jgi:DNA-binding transcriptional ArsR family regulator
MKVSKENLEKAAFILKTVAHPVRLGVINLLDKHQELAVNEICQYLLCEQSLISHHLSNMRIKGLLSSRREGTTIYYSLKEKDLNKLMECIKNCNVNM